MKKHLVKISDIVDEIESAGDERESFLNKVTGEITMITDEAWRAAEDGESPDQFPEWMRENIAVATDVIENPDKFISLPDRFDIHEYRLMESFSRSQEDEKFSSELLDAIAGKGAFRMFKLSIRRFEIEDRWFAFREEAFSEFARQWCKENEIEFTEE